jgi:hypothetical protein
MFNSQVWGKECDNQLTNSQTIRIGYMPTYLVGAKSKTIGFCIDHWF